MSWQGLLKGETLIDSLNEVLSQWESKKYPSDEQRWKEYAKDIKELIHKWEAPQDYNVNWDAAKKTAGAVMTSHAGIEPEPIYGKKKKRDDEE